MEMFMVIRFFFHVQADFSCACGQFELKFHLRLTTSLRWCYLSRWLSMALKTLAKLSVFVAALLAVLARDHITAGLAGLSITYATEVTGLYIYLETYCQS